MVFARPLGAVARERAPARDTGDSSYMLGSGAKKVAKGAVQIDGKGCPWVLAYPFMYSEISVKLGCAVPPAFDEGCGAGEPASPEEIRWRPFVRSIQRVLQTAGTYCLEATVPNRHAPSSGMRRNPADVEARCDDTYRDWSLAFADLQRQVLGGGMPYFLAMTRQDTDFFCCFSASRAKQPRRKQPGGGNAVNASESSGERASVLPKGDEGNGNALKSGVSGPELAGGDESLNGDGVCSATVTAGVEHIDRIKKMARLSSVRTTSLGPQTLLVSGARGLLVAAAAFGAAAPPALGAKLPLLLAPRPFRGAAHRPITHRSAAEAASFAEPGAHRVRLVGRILPCVAAGLFTACRALFDAGCTPLEFSLTPNRATAPACHAMPTPVPWFAVPDEEPKDEAMRGQKGQSDAEESEEDEEGEEQDGDEDDEPADQWYFRSLGLPKTALCPTAIVVSRSGVQVTGVQVKRAE